MESYKECTMCKGRKRLRVPKGNLLDENATYGPTVDYHDINCPHCHETGLEPLKPPEVIKQQPFKHPALVA